MRRIVPLTLIMMLLIISVATSFYQRSANHVSLFHSLLFAKNIIPDPKERVHFAHLTLAKELQNSCKRARPVSAPKGERWGSPHAVQTCLLGVEGAHLFDALLQDFFIDKHRFKSIYKVYSWMFQGSPLMLQLYLVYYGLPFLI